MLGCKVNGNSYWRRQGNGVGGECGKGEVLAQINLRHWFWRLVGAGLVEGLILDM